MRKISFFFVILFFCQAGFSANKPLPKSAAVTSKSGDNSAKNVFASPPKVKDDEYAIFLGEGYTVFKTKNFEKLELSENCFKSSKQPKCEAYEFAQIKPKNLTIKTPGMNNMAAIHCEAIGGRNLLAFDSGRNHRNFCWFSDGSMVNSWSMNYKHFPPRVVR